MILTHHMMLWVTMMVSLDISSIHQQDLQADSGRIKSTPVAQGQSTPVVLRRKYDSGHITYNGVYRTSPDLQVTTCEQSFASNFIVFLSV
jgi:hypothetical protein